MIRVQKPDLAPAILRNRGNQTTEYMKTAFEADPDNYRDGTKKFDFDSKLYGAKSVKKALLRAQYAKCCFCESKLRHISYGDVEHFRPKKGYRQIDTDDLGRPGYYWLANDWSNLFLSCQICNQRHKGNLFPLEDPARRAVSHLDDIGNEQRRFVDPAEDDPEEHISFREEVPYPVNNSTKGRTSISALGLERPELVEKRRTHLDMIRLIAVLANSGQPIPEVSEAQAFLARASLDDAEYASMARAFLAG